MKNEEVYKKEVEEGSLIRYEINEDHAPELSALGKIYRGYFNRHPRELSFAKDVYYYKGGWPKETTPPKAQAIANKIADAFLVLKYVDLAEDLEHYLAERGLKIEFIHDNVLEETFEADNEYKSDKKRSKLVDNWKELFDYPLPEDDKASILKALLLRGADKQKTICELADKIKIEKGEAVQEECDIKVGNYCRAVNLKFKLQKGKDIGEDLQRIEDEAAESLESLNVFNDSYVEKEKQDED
jgi:hypothetical protein